MNNKEDDIAWYHDNISRKETEELLLKDGNEEGSFVVRKSGSSTGDFVVSVLNNKSVAHFQIRRHAEDAFFSIAEKIKVHGLESLIEYYQENPNGIDGVKLTVPIKGELPPHDARRHGRTNLLHRATACGNYKVVLELLKTGYRHEAKNQNGQTAVHLASMYGHDDILQELIDFGANVNSRDTAAYTPLHYACQKNFVSTVKLLVREGKTNIQARNTENGWVPLHEASSAGHKEVIQELLSLNAPVKPRTKKNELPLHLAKANGHLECVEILGKYKPPTPKTERRLWYHGTLDRQEAESFIKNFSTENGTFLVRYSIRNRETVLTLFNEESFFNFIIKKQDDYYFIDDGPYLESLEHVIEYYSFLPDGLPTTLQFPVPPKPKPPVPECKTIPRQKKKIDNNPGTSAKMEKAGFPEDFPSHFYNIKFSSNFELNTTNNNNYTDDTGQQGNEFISEDRLKLVTKLGEGEFGSVWQGKYRQEEGEIDVAIKSLLDEQLETNRESFLSEAKVMMQLNHHCIVKLIGLSLGTPLYMVQELMKLGSMLNYIIIKKDQVNPDHEFVIWAAQIACGMQYLEEQRFVHRDLAARNILLASIYQAKISDFGLSRALGSGREYYRAKTGGKWPLKWYAPESFNYGTFSHKSDVWSFGITLWEMYSFGEIPYKDMKGSEAIQSVTNGERLEQPECCPDPVYQIMRSCWEYEAEKRPTFNRLFELFSNNTDYVNIKELIALTNLT